MNLQQILSILWPRKRIVLMAFLLTVLTTLIISLILPKEYLATTSIVIDQRTVDPLTGMALPVQLLPGYMATQTDIIGSHNVARKVVENLRLGESEKFQKKYAEDESTANILDWIAEKLIKNLEITPSKESSLIELGFTAADPQFAADVCNAFAEAYIHTSIELRSQPAKISSDWFNVQMSSLRERLERSQAKLSSYQQQYGIVGTDDRLDIENARLADLSKQLVESQGHTNELQSRINLLSSNYKQGASSESLQEVLDSGLISAIKTELAKKEATLSLLSKQLDKNHPQFREAEAEVLSLRQKINSEIRTVQNSMTSGLTSSKQRDEILANALEEQKAKVLELKKQYDEIAVLSHEVENQQKTYDLAMTRAVQTKMESEMSTTNISILNPAIRPDKPSKPKILLNLILSIFLGGILGVGAALAAETLDRRVRSAFDIIQTLELPVFAVVSPPAPSSKKRIS